MQDLTSIYALAFFSGILTTFQPCLFPLIPTYISYTTNSHDSIKKGTISSFFLTLGILVIFLSLALLIKLGQTSLIIFLNAYTVEFNIIMALILFFLGTLMVLRKEMTLFYSLPSFVKINFTNDNNSTVTSSFLLGLSYTLIAAPCAAPIFLGLISLIIVFDSLSIVITILVFSIGAGLPFLILGVLMPKFKSQRNFNIIGFMKWIKPISGIILILMSIFLFNVYYFPYYPLAIENFVFRGINENLMFNIYLLIFLIPLILIGIYILLVNIKNHTKSQEIQESVIIDN